MYLEHFKLEKFPFDLVPNTEFYYNLPEHQKALNVILIGLKNGEGFIKIIGEVGTGKTLLCRKVLNALNHDYVTAYIPIPDLNPTDLKLILAKELGVNVNPGDHSGLVLDQLQKKLIELSAHGKKVVVLIDEAQTMSDESLEALRLLSNLEAESHKLMHIILFAQPELDERLQKKHLRQLQQRITFSHYLKTLNFTEMKEYVRFRMVKSGHFQETLFNRACMHLLFQHSKGVPRLINTLCHKSLLSAYGRGAIAVQKKDMLAAINDGAGGHIEVPMLYSVACLSVVALGVAWLLLGNFTFLK